MTALIAQARAETAMTLRRGESLLLTLGIPVLLLVFFEGVDVLPVPAGVERIDFLAPGVLALAVMSTALVSVAIATGFEREYLVLKRLGTTPLGRGRLLAAKIAAVLVVQAVQIAVIAGVAVLLGWRPDTAGLAAAFLALLVATAAFAGIGLTLAGTLGGLTCLAVANGLYVVLLLLGGMVIPLTELPDMIATLARLTPAGALAEIFRGALLDGGTLPARPWIVLAGWAVAGPLVAARLFRWE